MEISPSDLPHSTVYKLLTGAVVPRPIAWVTTLNPAGQPNLAPFSYFNVVCPKPATLVFSTSVRGSDGGNKDTYHNLRHLGECVVNMVTEVTAEAMNITSGEFAPGVNEFLAAGLTPVPAKTVRPPRVLESPINFECAVRDIITLSDQPGGGHLVIASILHIHIRDEILYDGDKIDVTKYKPIGRLGGPNYTRVTDNFHMARPTAAEVEEMTKNL